MVCDKKKEANGNLKKLMHSIINFHTVPLVHKQQLGSYFFTTNYILKPPITITIIEVQLYGFTKCFIFQQN